MIKNELIKFFTPLKVIVYIGFLLTCILLPIVVFQDNEIIAPYDFICGSMNDVLVLIIPIILASIVSEVFTYDYELGCMKFFIIYRKRDKVLFAKIIALILIAATLIIISFITLIIIYAIQNPQMINALYNQIFDISKLMTLFLMAMMPIILIYVLISIICKNSMIISLIVFLLVMMSDLFVKFIADITPTRFFRVFLEQNKSIDNGSIIIFISYIVVLLFFNLRVFSKKEMLK